MVRGYRYTTYRAAALVAVAGEVAMKRTVISVVVGLAVITIFCTPVTAGLFDPNSPPPSTSRYEYPGMVHNSSADIGWGEPAVSRHPGAQKALIVSESWNHLFRFFLCTHFKILPGQDVVPPSPSCPTTSNSSTNTGAK